MVRVCKDMFPKGSYFNQRGDGFYMDDTFKNQMDILLKNIINDWDFTIIITGGGEVRVGKSVLAMQIGYYWTYMINKLYNRKLIFTVKNNFVFDGRQLIKKGNELGINQQFACLPFDEAGADLEGRKAMQTITQDVLDYYRECGQYNMLNILVLPEYFDLPKGIAMSRSIFLLDVYYTANKEGFFQRGYYNFYSRRNKKYLYLYGKRDLNYFAYRYDFHGRFFNFYPIDEKEYRAEKQKALKGRESKRRNKFQIQRDACWHLLCDEIGWSRQEVCKRMEQLTGIYVGNVTLHDGLKHFSLEK